MVILNVYQKCLQVDYKTKLFSKATLFALAILAVSVVLPYIISYKSRGFWLKHDSFYEQPQVQFKGEYIFVAVTTNVSTPIVCTNFPYLYKTSEKFDTCSIIKAREVDDDKDGKPEEFLFSFNAELLNNEMVQYFTLFFTIDYRLMTTCALHMQSAVLIQQAVPAFVSDLSLDAELTISQKAPLQCHRMGIDTHLNHSVVEEEDDVEKYKIGNILQNYFTRDLTTHASNLYTSFNTGKESEFAISLRLRYPEHLLYYKPSFWQMLKWAWIQYFVLYIVVAWIAERLKQYVYNNRLLLCYEEFPFKEKVC